MLLVAHFAELKDPRKHRHKVHYPLPLLLLIVFSAVLSGFSGWDAFADFAEDRREWLRALVPFEGDDTPSADAIRRVFERLNAEAFARCFTAWTHALATDLAGKVVAFDGKSVQGARDRGEPTVPLHLLHAWCVEQRLLLGVASAAGAPGEPAAIEQGLALLELRGAIVTADANGLSRAIADQVVRQRGEYVFALKANRSTVHAEVDAYFAPRTATLATGGFGAREAVDYVYGSDRGHGRVEFRQAWAVPATRFPALRAYLPHARAVLCIERSRRVGDGEVTCETHYYVSSLRPKAARLATIVRDHWSVENHLHRTLDVVLHEDDAQVRKGPGALNLALVRRVAATVLRRDTQLTGSMPRRMRKAALNDDYRTHLLTLGDS